MKLRKLTSLLSAALAVAATTSAQINLPPPDLNPGDPYRIIFITDGNWEGTSADIAFYNGLVDAEAQAAPALANLGTSFTAVASTLTVDAVDNTQTSPSIPGIPVYGIDGVRVADDYAQLWSGSVQSPIRVTSSGGGQPAVPFTGTGCDGTKLGPLGGASVRLGNHGRTNCAWIDWTPSISATYTQSLYGISGVVRAPGLAPPPDLNPGDPYRLVFVTDSVRDATSTDIADYNAFVTTDANNVEDLRSMNTTWSAIASSEAVSALDNTGTHYS
ncbi:MAG: hypothetical protein AAF628_29120, partial [Planctomycetota bacterium]